MKEFLCVRLRMCWGPRCAANSMAYAYCRVVRKMRRRMAWRQSGSETGHEINSTHAWITEDFCAACRPFTTSVGSGEDGREFGAFALAISAPDGSLAASAFGRLSLEQKNMMK